MKNFIKSRKWKGCKVVFALISFKDPSFILKLKVLEFLTREGNTGVITLYTYLHVVTIPLVRMKYTYKQIL